MTVKIFGESTVCEFRGLGHGCGACFDVSAPRCSFELNPAQVDQMVNELFHPWQHLTLSCSYFLLPLCTVFTNFFSLDLTGLSGRIIQNFSQANQLRSMAAVLESSAIRDTRELQSACADILASGSVEQVSYLFDPPAVLESLANIDLAALTKMDEALVQSGYLPGPRSTSVPQADPSTGTAVPHAGPSTSTMARTPSSSNNILMEHPPIVVIERPHSPEVPEMPEADELTMSGIDEDAIARAVGDTGKDADEDAADL
jgi:hypothetical protein